jgi:group I intron endonuclease
MEKIIGIYKLTSPNNKVYFGQTINWDVRKKHYKNKSGQRQPKLYYSLKKYGWNMFKKEIIEICNVEQLNEREIHYKQQFINEFGWDKALFCEIYDTGGGPKSQETKMKMSISHLGKKHSKKTCDKISKNRTGKCHSEENKQKMKMSRIGKTSSKPILQYDLDGNFIKEWVNTKQTQEYLNLYSITGALQKKNRSAGGYQWRYKNDLLEISKFKQNTRSKPIIQYNLDGSFIKEWNSTTEASKTIKCSISIISACLIGKYETAVGFKWKFKNKI